MTQTLTNPQVDTVLHFHEDVQKWNASIYFIENEIQFISKEIHSYLFEPTTPNLFELLQEFKFEIAKIEEGRLQLVLKLQEHVNAVKSILPFDAMPTSDLLMENHKALGEQHDQFLKRFQELKSKVLQYTGAVLNPYGKQELAAV